MKKVHILLNEYFRYLTEEGFIQKNPMQSVPMMKRSNFLAAQDKEFLPEQEQVTVFTPTEIAKFKREAFSTFANGKRKYQQAAAYGMELCPMYQPMPAGDGGLCLRVCERFLSRFIISQG